MATIGPGGNYFSQINQNLAKGPDLKTSENLRQTGGTANTQRKSSTGKKGAVQEEGSHLSEAAKKSLQASHQESIEGHEHELAQQAGLQEFDPESNESHELKLKRGHERDQEEKAEAANNGQLAEGFVKVQSPQGVEQVLAPDQVDALSALDGDLDHVENRVLGDIPPSTLEAAERVLDTQLKDGLKPVAKLKPVPEAQDAGRMELGAVDFMVEPLDIRESGNDRSLPMSLDFPDSMTDIAHEMAATQLANGGASDEELMAGGGSFSASSQNQAAGA